MRYNIKKCDGAWGAYGRPCEVLGIHDGNKLVFKATRFGNSVRFEATTQQPVAEMQIKRLTRFVCDHVEKKNYPHLIAVIPKELKSLFTSMDFNQVVAMSEEDFLIMKYDFSGVSVGTIALSDYRVCMDNRGLVVVDAQEALFLVRELHDASKKCGFLYVIVKRGRLGDEAYKSLIQTLRMKLVSSNPLYVIEDRSLPFIDPGCLLSQTWKMDEELRCFAAIEMHLSYSQLIRALDISKCFIIASKQTDSNMYGNALAQLLSLYTIESHAMGFSLDYPMEQVL
jgi:hypothetical protein